MNVYDFDIDITGITIKKNTLIIGEVKSSDLKDLVAETNNIKTAF